MSTEAKKKDEIDELLLAETDMTDEDLDRIDEDIENTPRIDEVEADEVVPPEKQDSDGTKPYDPTDEFDDE